MLLAKVVKYKILEFCIDNFFEILSNNLNIFDKSKPYNVRVYVASVESASWMMAINVEISGLDFEYFENKVSFESCQDIVLSMEEEMATSEITGFLLRDFIMSNTGKIDRTILLKIVANVRRNVHQIIFKH